VADLSDTLHLLVDDVDLETPPSAEVRRQGDLLRRRRIALRLLIALAVVVLVTAGLSLAGERVDAHGNCRSVAGTADRGTCDGRG